MQGLQDLQGYAGLCRKNAGFAGFCREDVQNGTIGWCMQAWPAQPGRQPPGCGGGTYQNRDKGGVPE